MPELATAREEFFPPTTTGAERADAVRFFYAPAILIVIILAWTLFEQSRWHSR